MLWIALDRLFFVLHTLLIAFNLTGWAWKRTRLAHLVVFGATAFSWFVLGAYYGWGYCLCTDWHWRIRERLGQFDQENSYIQMLANRMFGMSLSHAQADWIGGIAFAFIAIATATVWARQWLQGTSRCRVPLALIGAETPKSNRHIPLSNGQPEIDRPQFRSPT